MGIKSALQVLVRRRDETLGNSPDSWATVKAEGTNAPGGPVRSEET
jgi:hypothetical protein